MSIGDIDKPLGHGVDQPRASHHRHDSGVKRILENDPTDGFGAFADGGYILGRSSHKHYPEEDDSEVDHIDVEGSAAIKVEGQITDARQTDQAAQHPAVIYFFG